MGNEKYVNIPAGLLYFNELTDSEKIFLMRIYHIKADIGFCNATDEELAELGGYSTRTVRRLIQRLKDTGLLHTDKNNKIYKRIMIENIDIFN